MGQQIGANPLGAQEQVSTASQTANPYAANMQYLAANHSWMPATAQVGIAQSSLDPTAVQETASAMQSAFAAAGKGLNYIYSDPVLSKSPTLLTTLRQYTNSTIGPPPIAGGTIDQTQQALISKGFGTNLAPGLWTPAWAAAFKQYTNQLKTDQLAGNKPGSKSAGGVLHMLTAIMPKEAANALVGYVKALPHLTRQVLSDVVGGGIVGAGALVPEALMHGGDFGAGERAATKLGQSVGAAINGQSQQKYTDQFNAHPIGRAFDDINTVLLVYSLVSGAAAVAGKVGESLAAPSAENVWSNGLKFAGSGPEGAQAAGAAARASAAEQGLSRAATEGLVKSSVRAAANDLGINEAYRANGVIANSIGRTADLAGSAISNIPAMDRLGPWVGKLNDADGFYYRMRTMAALPYELKPVQVAGQLTSSLGIAGGAVRASAAVSGALNGGDAHSSLATSIQSSNTMDAVDGVLKKAKVFGITPNMDDLAYILHAPEAGLKASELIAGQANQAANATDTLLGHMNMSAITELATGKDWPKMMKDTGIGMGTPEELTARKWFTSKFNGWAANLVARREMVSQLAAMDDPPGMGDPAWMDMAQRIESDVLADPQKLDEARTVLMSDPEQIVQQWKREIEMTQEAGDPEEVPGLKKYVLASQHLTNGVLPYQNSHILSDQSMAINRASAEVARMKQMGESFSQDWIEGSAIDPKMPKANVGMARLRTVLQPDAERAASEFEDRLKALRPTETPRMNDDGSPMLNLDGSPITETHGPKYEDQVALDRDIRDYLLNTFKIDARKAPQDEAGGIQAIRDRAKYLANPVHIADNAPQPLKDAVQAINDGGYQVVTGRDIGWMHTDLPTLDPLEGPRTFQRKWIQRIGLDPANVTPQSIGMSKTTKIRKNLYALSQKPDFTMAPYYNVDTIMRDANDKTLDRSPGNLAERGIRAALGIRSADRDIASESALARNSNLTRAELDRQINGQAIDDASSALGLTTMRRKDFVDKMTRTDFKPQSTDAHQLYDLEQAGHPDLQTPLFSKKDANRMYRAIIKGSAGDDGARLSGIQHVEDMMRGSFGFLGERVPGDFGEKLANLPNAYVELRNKLRFNLNPELSMRRVIKTNLQLATENVDPTFRPNAAMRQAGTIDSDRATLARLLPGMHAGLNDDATDVLKANDVFHLYNHADYMAYAAGKMERDGRSDQEIKNVLVRVFDYGNRSGVEGRSALERSTNFMFFPFSFDKKLYRNMGAYLLDHPAQTLMLDHAMAAYKDFSTNHPDAIGSGGWLQDHIPILQEAERMNAFAHGVGMGQFGAFGALNAPIMNAFMPQNWSRNALTSNTDEVGALNKGLIDQFIPAVKAMKNVVNQGGSTGNIVGTGIGNKWNDIFGKAPITTGGVTFANIHQYNATNWKQIEEGNAAFENAKATFKSYTDWNNTHSDPDKKYRLPLDPKYGNYAGQILTTTLLGDVIHAKYPGFDRTAAAEAAVAKPEAVRQYLYSLPQGSPQSAAINNIITAAQTLAKGLQTGNLNINGHSVPYTVERRQVIQSSIRDQAGQLAQKDSRFYKVWNDNFASLYGPLERIQ